MYRRTLATAFIFLTLLSAIAFAQERLVFPKADSLDALQKVVEAEAGKVAGGVGVYILHVESGRTVTINADQQYQLASVFKIPVLVTLFKRIDEGYFSLDDRILLTEKMKTYGSGLLAAMKAGLDPSINDLQLLMMAVSDNTATDILFDLVGADEIAKYMKELGLEKTVIDLDTRALILGYLGLDMGNRLTIQELSRVPAEFWMSEERRKRMAEFDGEVHDFSTPREIGIILEKLVKGEIINREVSDQIIETLKHHTGARLITRFLPFGINVARKGGSLGRDWRQTVLNDSGIVFLPGEAGHLVVCVFGNDLQSPWYEFEEMVGYVTRYAYDYFVTNYKPEE
jgi:beta-lactamase class A